MIGIFFLICISIAAIVALTMSVLIGLALSFTALSPLVVGGVVGGIAALVLTLAFTLICTTGLFDIAKGEGKKLTLKEIIPLSMFCIMSVAIGAGLVDISPILASSLIKAYLFFNYIEIYDILAPIEVTTADSLLAIAITAPILSLVALTVICIAWEYISDKIGKILSKKPRSYHKQTKHTQHICTNAS
ncbi:MAG TPA: hypothetical protein DEQ74_01415, partial [Wolbachia sp.]|nr:hypothetical protein [Wolbachia sp.]